MQIRNPFLSVRDLSYSYHSRAGETKALDHISFDLYPGEFAAIIGTSGCGKSTLLDLIAGQLPLTEGNIEYHRKSAAADKAFSFPDGNRPATSHTQSRPSIGYMLQKDHLLEYRTVCQNVLLGLEIRHKLTEENISYVRNLMEQYGIAEFAHARPSELSGGMRQRAALIRTLAMKPDLLLLDEPFSALDYQTRLFVTGDIRDIIRRENITTLLVTHDLSEAISTSDRVIVLGSRPGHIRTIITIDFGEDHPLTPQEARIHPRFPYYFNMLWKELCDEKADNKENSRNRDRNQDQNQDRNQDQTGNQSR